jgi:hypothetical protein
MQNHSSFYKMAWTFNPQGLILNKANDHDDTMEVTTHHFHHIIEWHNNSFNKLFC